MRGAEVEKKRFGVKWNEGVWSKEDERGIPVQPSFALFFTFCLASDATDILTTDQIVRCEQ